GPRLALSRDELRQTTLRLTPELPGRYRFALKVHGCDGRATFTFEVPRNSKGGPERRPVARIAPVGRTRVGEEVVLDGTRSADPDGGALTFRWRQTGGLVVKPEGEGARVCFAPTRAGDYSFALTVVDEAGFRSRPGSVVVTVLPPMEPARADPAAADPLDRPFSVRIENRPVSVLLARLSDAGVTVRASREVTRTHPFGTSNVDLWVVDLPARKVLDWLGRMLGAFYVIEKPGVVWFARGTRWLERRKPVVASYRIDALYEEDDASDLMRLLEESLKGALWSNSGASLGRANLAADTITAVLPRSAQSRLGRVLAELRREVPSGPPEDEAGPALGRLMSRTVRARYHEWPVREIAWDLARQARVPVGFAPLGKDGGKRISLDLGEVPLREGLDRFCRAAGFAGHRVEPPGAVWLFSKGPPLETSECLWSAAEVRSYDVRQLRAAHGFAGPMVAHLVKSRVMPARWKDPFVSVGYAPTRGRLVVVHSSEVHLAVAAFLARLAREGEKALAD
ncbi:MAG: PKD domain-containing protein, partial [Planctomycetota bacterium]